MLFLTEMPKEARDKILFASLTLFSSEGYKKTSVLDIVEMARVSKTTFYQNFTGKEDLMAVLIDVLSTEIIEEVKISTNGERRQAYKAYIGIKRYIEINFNDLRVANLMLVESVGVSPGVEEVRSKAHRGFAELIFQNVYSRLPKSVSDLEMHIVSQAMVGAINEVVVQNYSKEMKKRIPTEQLARLLNRIVVGAFVNLKN